jgi:hypothetical protein
MADLYPTVQAILAAKEPTEPLAGGLERYDLGVDGLSMIYNPTDDVVELDAPLVRIRPTETLIVKFGDARVMAIIQQSSQKGFWMTVPELTDILEEFLAA